MNKLIISVIAGGALLLNAAPAFATQTNHDNDVKVNICRQETEGRDKGNWKAEDVKTSDVTTADFTYGGPTKDEGKIDNKDHQADDWCKNNVPQVKYCLDKETLSQDFNKDLPKDAVAGECVVVVPPVVVATPSATPVTPTKLVELPNTGSEALGLGLLGLVVAGLAGGVRFLVRKK